ncbi:hypothetical protein BDV96DRAFT_689104 [Lophiotrema nucula]|uniref:Uncharacterized protein n=1 Tax=Lophiotrema nucula TaxID=690887 RepID=A0A6A5Z0E1_9PLEO|nr:hypothetical protein BDV96DRAFT_689104 [Lophiotrema nucula]
MHISLQLVAVGAFAMLGAAMPAPLTQALAQGYAKGVAKRGVFYPACALACTPLVINPVAYAACLAGCSATAQDDGDVIGVPQLQDDGTVDFITGTPIFHDDGTVNFTSCDAAAKEMSEGSESDDSSVTWGDSANEADYTDGY